MKIFVPADAAAVAVGADDVAAALARAMPGDTTIVRTGSRGLFWLEPLIEIERDGQRIGFGPISADEVPELVDALTGNADHPAALGPVDQLVFLRSQTRLSFARCGIIDPLSIEDYERHGGLAGLRRVCGHRLGQFQANVGGDDVGSFACQTFRDGHPDSRA